MNQLHLWPVNPWKCEPEATMDDRFRAFHEANPHIYDNLRRLALDLVANGRSHYGIGSLFEVLRWHYELSTDSDFKLNNNYRACYARLLMQEEPRLSGFFRCRKRKAGEERV